MTDVGGGVGRGSREVSVEGRNGRRQCHGFHTPLVAWLLATYILKSGYANMTHGHSIGMTQNGGGGRPVIYKN